MGKIGNVYCVKCVEVRLKYVYIQCLLFHYLYWRCINSDEVNTLEMLCSADASLVVTFKNCKVNVDVFNFRDKARYRSRSRSHDGRRGVERSRSQSYDHYDKYYSTSDKLSSKSRSKHSSRGLDDERIRSKDRR